MAFNSASTPIRVLRQTWITRADLRANRELIYVFGDNVEREGQRGLAREMRGESNAHSISISWSAFEAFDGASYEAAIGHIRDDIEALLSLEPTIIVWPMSGLVPEFITLPDRIETYLRQSIRQTLGLKNAI